MGAITGEGGPLRGEDTAGGDVTFGGVGIFRGEAVRCGEYVRGDPSVAGERSPLGDARDENGSPERPVVGMRGVPAVCSGSGLKSRGTAEGRRGCGISAGQWRLNPLAGAMTGAVGVVSVPTSRDVRGGGISAAEIMVHWISFSVVSGMAWIPLERYFFLLLLDARDLRELRLPLELPSLFSLSSSSS